jgi:hypothetical protein
MIDEKTADAQQTARAAIINAYGIKTQAGRIALILALDNISMLDRKQQDYGPGNIASFGELGVLVRTNDKVERLKNLWRTNRMSDPQNESVSDSWRDLSNYGLIGEMCHRGIWPVSEEQTAQDPA